MRRKGADPNFVSNPAVTTSARGSVFHSKSRGVAAPQPGYHIKEDR